MYEDAFETKFLKATEALYHEEGNRYMQETDVSFHPLYKDKTTFSSEDHIGFALLCSTFFPF